jgi:hypothetical protein
MAFEAKSLPNSPPGASLYEGKPDFSQNSKHYSRQSNLSYLEKEATISYLHGNPLTQETEEHTYNKATALYESIFSKRQDTIYQSNNYKLAA